MQPGGQEVPHCQWQWTSKTSSGGEPWLLCFHLSSSSYSMNINRKYLIQVHFGTQCNCCFLWVSLGHLRASAELNQRCWFWIDGWDENCSHFVGQAERIWRLRYYADKWVVQDSPTWKVCNRLACTTDQGSPFLSNACVVRSMKMLKSAHSCRRESLWTFDFRTTCVQHASCPIQNSHAAQPVDFTQLATEHAMAEWSNRFAAFDEAAVAGG